MRLWDMNHYIGVLNIPIKHIRGNVKLQMLDKLSLRCGKELNGIIDFSSTKHLIVVDFTNNSSPVTTQRLIEWRLYYPNLRFTVYASMFGISHPLPILINKRDVLRSTLANPAQRIKKIEKFIV